MPEGTQRRLGPYVTRRAAVGRSERKRSLGTVQAAYKTGACSPSPAWRSSESMTWTAESRSRRASRSLRGTRGSAPRASVFPRSATQCTTTCCPRRVICTRRSKTFLLSTRSSNGSTTRSAGERTAQARVDVALVRLPIVKDELVLVPLLREPRLALVTGFVEAALTAFPPPQQPATA